MLKTVNPFSVKEELSEQLIDELLKVVEEKERCDHQCDRCFLFRDDDFFSLGPECQRERIKKVLLSRKRFLEILKNDGN